MLGTPSDSFGRFAPFAQVFVGVAHAGNYCPRSGGSQNPFAPAIGGGMDCRLTNHIRLPAGEVDYLWTHISEVDNANTRVQNNLRVRTEVVFRFCEQPLFEIAEITR